MVREFSNADMESVLKIWLDASLIAHDFVDSAFWRSKVPEMRDIHIPSSETYVYDDGGEVKGFFSLYEDALAAIFVCPAHQGQGIGQRLIEKAKALRHPLFVDVYKANRRTIAFYRQCGFGKVGEKVDPNTGEPEWVMEYRSSLRPAG